MTTEEAVRHLLKAGIDKVNLRFAEFASCMGKDPELAKLARHLLQEASQEADELRRVLHGVIQGQYMRAELLRLLAHQSQLRANQTGQPLDRFRVTYFKWIDGVDTELGSVIMNGLNEYHAQGDGERWLTKNNISFDSTIVDKLDHAQRSTSQTGGTAPTPVEDQREV